MADKKGGFHHYDDPISNFSFSEMVERILFSLLWILAFPPSSLCLSGAFYLLGIEVGKETAAFEIFSEDANNGDSESQNNLGVCYEHGIGVEKNQTAAFEWYSKATDQGNVYAQYNLGACYANGVGIEKNETAAFHWFNESAHQGNANAQYNLGYCYQNGKGVEKNEALAFEWLSKAADQGHSSAKFHLGFCYQKGIGVEKNETAAFEWYSESAKEENPDAHLHLGYCYEFGKGVEKNETAAFEWYSKAADQGVELARISLGHLYEQGIGVEKNDYRAFDLHSISAARGHELAKDFLGGHFTHGIGVEKNEQSAFHWYSEAAKQGVIEAHLHLGYCYEHGKGVEKNEDLAFQHYCKHLSSLSIHRDLDDSAFFSASVIRGSPNDQIFASAANGNLNLIVAKWTDEYRFAVNMHGENALFIAIRNNQAGIIEYLKYCARFDMEATATDLNMTPYEYYQLFPHFNDETSQLLFPSKTTSSNASIVMISRCHRIRSLLDGNDIDQSLTEFKSFLSDSTGVNAFFLDILLEEILAEETVNMHRLQMISLMISLYEMTHERIFTLDYAEFIVSFVSKHQSSQFLEIIRVMEDLVTAVDLEKYLSLGAESQFSRHRYSIRRLKSQKDSERLDQVARLALYFHKKNLLMDEEADLHNENAIVHNVYKQVNSAGSGQIKWSALHLLAVGVFACFY